MMKQLPAKKQNAVIGIKPLLAILVCVSLVYSACRKTENAPAPKTTQSTDVTAQTGSIALNLAQSLSGKLGGANVMGGVDSSTIINGHKIVDQSALCGFFTDSLVNYNKTSGDTTWHTGGNLKLYWNCKDGKTTGYTAYDSLNTVTTIPTGVAQHYVKQYYTITALTDNHQLIGVNGSLYYHNQVTTKCNCSLDKSSTWVETANYILKDLTIDVCPCAQDILSGTATFTAEGPGWAVNGTIVFLGHHMADVTINGTVYHVNMLTKKVTT